MQTTLRLRLALQGNSNNYGASNIVIGIEGSREVWHGVYSASSRPASERASERVSDLVDLDNHPHRNTTTGYCVLQMKWLPLHTGLG